MAPQGRVVNALTVDVEDYFHVSAFRHVVRQSDWETMESRVERNTDRVLALFDEKKVKGTFFVLGWVAERHPALIKRIHDAGHELACHSYWHRLVYDLTREEFREDTARAKKVIEDAAGVAVRAYRAPSFSIVPRSAWALDVLAELGFTVDSSLFPIRHDLYGFPSVPRRPFRIAGEGAEIMEFPPPTVQFGGMTLPVTGGGYLRILPLGLQLHWLRKIAATGTPFTLYLHPWEVDPEQPRLQAPLKSRLRHYTGLRSTADRLRRLLREFPFGTMSEALSQAQLQVFDGLKLHPRTAAAEAAR